MEKSRAAGKGLGVKRVGSRRVASQAPGVCKRRLQSDLNDATNVVSGIISIFYSVFTPVINAFCTRKLHL